MRKSKPWEKHDLRARSDELIEHFGRLQAAFHGEKERLERLHGELERTYFRYRQLFELAPLGFLTLDDRGVVKEVNHAGAVLLALDRRRNVRFDDFVHPEDRTIYQQHVAAARSTGASVEGEVRLRTGDGALLYARLDSKIFMQVRGFVSAHLMVVTDISDRKQTERDLHEAKELAEATVSSFSDAVITTDADGRITGLNAIADVLTGWSSAEARGRHLDAVFRLFDEEDGRPLRDRINVDVLAQPTELAADNAYVTLMSRSGERRFIRGSIAPIRSRGGPMVGAVVTFADASESRRIMREVVYHASHDTLTGLLNRREFEKRLGRAVISVRQSAAEHVLCFLDLDHFKLVNDVAGHRAGDELLKRVAGTAAGLVRGGDAVGRLGGDEFAILLENCSLAKAVAIAELIARNLRQQPFVWEGHRFEVSASIGVAAITAGMEGWQQALGQADAACYAAKAGGRNRLHVNGARHPGPVAGANAVRADQLRDALSAGRFRFMCQPIFSLRAGGPPGVAAYEILLRLEGRRGRLHLPADFFPMADRYGLMGALDRWVLQTIFRRGRSLVLGPEPCAISVNISGQSLNDPSLLEFVQSELAESGFPRNRLWIEVTESAAIHNVADAACFMREVRGQGCRIALDDFGKGLSSFTYLKQFPVDLVKIDRSFVHNLKLDRFDRSVVAAIVGVARDLGIRTVGEGVETPAALSVLDELGVDYAQGYAMGIPAPLQAEPEAEESAAAVEPAGGRSMPAA